MNQLKLNVENYLIEQLLVGRVYKQDLKEELLKTCFNIIDTTGTITTEQINTIICKKVYGF